MKKFKFTLATLLKVKEALEKQKKQELAEAEQALALARRELEALEGDFERRRQEHNAILQEGADAVELQSFARYFEYLRERIRLQRVKIRQAEAERQRRREALVEAMTEVKALDKLKEAQYEAYKLELKAEQEREIGDFVSFQTVSK